MNEANEFYYELIISQFWFLYGYESPQKQMLKWNNMLMSYNRLLDSWKFWRFLVKYQVCKICWLQTQRDLIIICYSYSKLLKITTKEKLKMLKIESKKVIFWEYKSNSKFA